MTWYAAHVITYLKYLDGKQDTYPIWENVVLIESSSDDVDVLLEEIERIAKESYEIPESESLSGWRPATWVVAGVRKIIECRDTPVKPLDPAGLDATVGHGTEATYSKMRVDSKEALEQLVQGEPVTVVYEE